MDAGRRAGHFDLSAAQAHVRLIAIAGFLIPRPDAQDELWGLPRCLLQHEPVRGARAYGRMISLPPGASSGPCEKTSLGPCGCSLVAGRLSCTHMERTCRDCASAGAIVSCAIVGATRRDFVSFVCGEAARPRRVAPRCARPRSGWRCTSGPQASRRSPAGGGAEDTPTAVLVLSKT